MSVATQTPPLEIESLVKSREVGYSLKAPFYTSQEVFDLDVAAIFARHWLFSAAEAEIPEAGDYVTIDIGPYSVIILRDDDEEIRAFHNVCRHRGSRLLKEPVRRGREHRLPLPPVDLPDRRQPDLRRVPAPHLRPVAVSASGPSTSETSPA